MIMIKLNSKKGITLVSVIITVILLLILSAVIINGIDTSNNVAPYNNMIADIALLEDKIQVYYNKYREIPVLEKKYNEYYKIDLSKLDNITLTYGTNKDENDIYLVNNSLEVYYLKGTELNGKIHHTKSD